MGTLGKIARDIALHSQTEIGELREAAGEQCGGSSAMPHKQNPVACAVILSAAARFPGLVSTMLVAMQQEDERSVGLWPAEWETLPETICLTAGAVHQLASLIPRLEIDTARMRESFELTRGLVFSEGITAALGEKIGRAKARALIESGSQRALKGKIHLRNVIKRHAELGAAFSAAELDKLFDATNYADAASLFVDRVLNIHKSLQHYPAQERACLSQKSIISAFIINWKVPRRRRFWCSPIRWARTCRCGNRNCPRLQNNSALCATIRGGMAKPRRFHAHHLQFAEVYSGDGVQRGADSAVPGGD